MQRTPAAANQIPGTYPVLDFKRQLGPGSPGPYDGSAEDYLRLPAGLQTGDALRLELVLSKPAAFSYQTLGSGLPGHWQLLGNTFSAAYTIQNTAPDAGLLERQAENDFTDYSLKVTRSDAPLAQLSAAQAGADPLLFNLDASASSDSDGIAQYQFNIYDYNATPDWIDNGANPVLQHSFPMPGHYNLRARVYDSLGAVCLHNARLNVQVGNAPYGEVENNDSVAQANLLSFPLSAFYGSVGSGVDTPGYDGDPEDYYRFNAAPGQTLQLSFAVTSRPGSVSASLRDAAGQQLKLVSASPGSPPSGSLQYSFSGAVGSGSYTLILRSEPAGKANEYVLSGTLQ